MSRIIFYTLFISFLIFILPLPGSTQESNKLTEAMFLRDNKLAVTFPWKGILIKQGLSSRVRATVLEHENCHIDQINKYGIMFMVEYLNNQSKFELECYKLENKDK